MECGNVGKTLQENAYLQIGMCQGQARLSFKNLFSFVFRLDTFIILAAIIVTIILELTGKIKILPELEADGGSASTLVSFTQSLTAEPTPTGDSDAHQFSCCATILIPAAANGFISCCWCHPAHGCSTLDRG